MACSLANIGECLPESFVQYFWELFNKPLQPLLTLVQKLFTEPLDVSAYKSLWLVIVSIIGLFYGLAFLYAGFNFIVAGFDASRKDAAKTWLKNILMMLVMVQASYWLYQLLVEIGSLLTAGVFSMIPAEFFLVKVDSMPDLGMLLPLTVGYVVVLLLTALMLVVRYLLVAAGLLFFPVGLFLYFLPPLRSLGRMVLWLCCVAIFMTFFASVGLLMASKLAPLDIFARDRTLLMIASFLLADLAMVAMWAFSILKGALSLADVSITQSITSSLKLII